MYSATNWRGRLEKNSEVSKYAKDPPKNTLHKYFIHKFGYFIIQDHDARKKLLNLKELECSDIFIPNRGTKVQTKVSSVKYKI